MREVIRNEKGQIMGTKPGLMPTIEELLERGIPVPFSGCLLWEGMTDEDGYPLIERRGKNLRVTRLILEMRHGRKLGKLLACHTCDVPPCIEPRHLFAGTNTENLVDAYMKNRKFGMPGDAHPMSRFDEKTIIEILAYKNSGLSQAAIAKLFGTTQKNICYLFTGKAWRHLPRR